MAHTLLRYVDILHLGKTFNWEYEELKDKIISHVPALAFDDSSVSLRKLKPLSTRLGTKSLQLIWDVQQDLVPSSSYSQFACACFVPSRSSGWTFFPADWWKKSDYLLPGERDGPGSKKASVDELSQELFTRRVLDEAPFLFNSCVSGST